MAEAAERGMLPARGRIYGADGRVNGPGQAITSARLYRYDDESKVVTIRVDHPQVPEFWLELDVRQDQMEAFIAEETHVCAQDKPLCVICGSLVSGYVQSPSYSPVMPVEVGTELPEELVI